VYAATLGVPTPPVGMGQERAMRGASNAKARHVLYWSPLYSSWREGFAQVMQEWKSQAHD
jgi:hypothetical protein